MDEISAGFDSSEPLHLATREEPSLPDASFAFAGLVQSLDVVELERNDEITPRLSARWLSRCEPQLSENFLLDVSCAGIGCNVTPKEEGCAVAIDLSTCLATENALLGGSLDASGRFHLANGSYNSTCLTETPRFGAVFDLMCGACRVSAYSEAVPLSAAVDTQTIEAISRQYSIEFEHRPFGYAHGLVVHEDLAITNFKDYGDEDPSYARCAPSERGERLHAFDVESMEPVWTSSIPGCLGTFGFDPSRNEVLVVLDTVFDLLRYDLSGRLEARVPLEPHLRVPPDREQLAPVGLLYVPGPPATIAITFEGLPSFLLLLDAETLSPREVVSFESDGIRQMLLVGDQFWLFDDDADRLYLVDPSDGSILEQIDLRTALQLQRNVAEFLFDPHAGRVFGSHVSLDGGVLSVDRSLTDLRGTIPVLGVVGSPFGLALWPPDPTQILVAATDRSEERRTWLTLLEAGEEASRFRPVLKEVGRGPLRYLTPGPGGSIFGVFTWTAELIRIRP